MVMAPRVQLVSKPGTAHSGIGRYAAELECGLTARGVELLRAPLRNLVPPRIAAAGQRFGYDLDTFFKSYPLRARTQAGSLTHLTSQTLGALVFTQRLPRPVVITVHDILPYLLRGDADLNVYRTPAQRLMDTLAMRGLKRADRLVADSHYTKSSLIGALGIPEDRIDVVHLGVDSQRFQPGAVPPDFRRRFDIPDDRPYLLFVGSEDPRKNLRTLFQAFAHVRRDVPNAVLLKVGASAFAGERRANLRLCTELGIAGAVRFFDDVDEDDLSCFYRAAAVLAFPSLYEGFGFPVLEALASGTPVVAADASSIPELTGAAARLVDGRSIEAFAAALIETLREPPNRTQARVAQAAGFGWTQTIDRTLAVYGRAAASRTSRHTAEPPATSVLSRRVDQ